MANPKSMNAAASAEDLAAKFERHKRLLPDFTDDLEPATEAAWPAVDAAAALDRARGCLLGAAIGESLAATVQALPRDEFPEAKELVGGGSLNLAPGEWGSGTATSLLLAESILATGTVEQDDFMTRLVAWLTNGTGTPSGKSVGIGATTRAAIERFIQNDEEPAAGSADENAAGNGSLVRVAPIAVRWSKQPGVARFLSNKQSRTTHGTIECLDACELFTAQLVDALTGADKDTAVRPRVMKLVPNVLAINAGEWKQKSRDLIASSGYVVDTLEAALWCVWHGTDFRTSVTLAANLGDDSAAVATVTGQLAGALYGSSGIPQTWLKAVAWREKIERLATDLHNASQS